MDGQLIGSTLGVKCHVKTDTGTGIPRVRNTTQAGRVTLMHVQTVVVYTLSFDTGSLNCLTTGVTAGYRPKGPATRGRTETPSPAALNGPDDVTIGRTTHAN